MMMMNLTNIYSPCPLQSKYPVKYIVLHTLSYPLLRHRVLLTCVLSPQVSQDNDLGK